MDDVKSSMKELKPNTDHFPTKTHNLDWTNLNDANLNSPTIIATPTISKQEQVPPAVCYGDQEHVVFEQVDLIMDIQTHSHEDNLTSEVVNLLLNS